MAKAFKVLGTTTDVTDCQLCGRTDLKGTIALAPLDVDGNQAGETVYYGSDCGAKAAGWTQKDIRQKAKSADDARAREEQIRRTAARRVEDARWQSWLDAQQTGKTERIEQIQALGGLAKARAQYQKEMAA